jgi:hypothetical protein
MLHPQARVLLDFIEQRGLPPTHTLSPTEACTRTPHNPGDRGWLAVSVAKLTLIS